MPALLSDLSIGRSTSDGRAAAAEGAEDHHEDDRADEGHDDAADQADAPRPDQADHEPADQRAHEAHDEVADDAVATPLHHEAGQPAGHQADDDPGKNASRLQLHEESLLWCLWRRSASVRVLPLPGFSILGFSAPQQLPGTSLDY